MQSLQCVVKAYSYVRRNKEVQVTHEQLTGVKSRLLQYDKVIKLQSNSWRAETMTDQQQHLHMEPMRLNLLQHQRSSLSQAQYWFPFKCTSGVYRTRVCVNKPFVSFLKFVFATFRMNLSIFLYHLWVAGIGSTFAQHLNDLQLSFKLIYTTIILSWQKYNPYVPFYSFHRSFFSLLKNIVIKCLPWLCLNVRNNPATGHLIQVMLLT